MKLCDFVLPARKSHAIKCVATSAKVSQHDRSLYNRRSFIIIEAITRLCAKYKRFTLEKKIRRKKKLTTANAIQTIDYKLLTGY